MNDHGHTGEEEKGKTMMARVIVMQIKSGKPTKTVAEITLGGSQWCEGGSRERQRDVTVVGSQTIQK